MIVKSSRSEEDPGRTIFTLIPWEIQHEVSESLTRMEVLRDPKRVS